MSGKSFSGVAEDTVRVVELLPEKGVLAAIGRDHTLATALADLVDNSIDAHADTVTIRLVTTNALLHTVRVGDNGGGMDAETLQLAMRLGVRRDYGEEDHGHFGIGLKAASLSQARSLTVFTLTEGEVPCAMRIRRDSFKGEVLTDDAAWAGFEDDPGSLDSTGTVVEWAGVENVSRSPKASERLAWLEEVTSDLRAQLGLTFHRLLSSGRLRLGVEIFDDAVALVGVRRNIDAIDPFGFSISGHASYPLSIAGRTDDGTELTATLHIIPPNSKSSSADLFGRPRREWQGFYIYRKDRLLQAGGWLEQARQDRLLQLARVTIDLTPALEVHLRINHEKHGVRPLEGFGLALHRARSSGGVGFEEYLSDARDVFQRANKRRIGVKPLIPISEGLSPSLIGRIRERVGERSDGDPIAIKWRVLEKGRLFLFDPEARTIWLNEIYRFAIGGSTGDGPLIATLAYLLLQDRFTSQHVRRGTKEEVEAWQSVLADALEEQIGSAAQDQLIVSARPVASDSLNIGALAPSSSSSNEEASAQAKSSPLSDPNTHTVVGLEVKGREEETVATPATLVNLYAKGVTIAEVGRRIGLDVREVVRILSIHLLELDDQVDDESVAPRNGLVFTPGERDRIVAAYRSGRSIPRIALDLGRTELAVSWQLLEHPSRPVLVSKSLIRRLRRLPAAREL